MTPGRLAGPSGGEPGAVAPAGRARPGRPSLRRAWPLLALLVLVAAFFWPFLSAGKVFLAADTLYGFLPWQSYAPPGFRPHNTLITDPVNGSYAAQYNRQLKEEGLWRWSPLVTLGAPATLSPTQGGPGRWYPVKMLAHRVLDTPSAFTALLALHLLLMGGFMYLFLARIGAGRRGALFGAVVYMLNGCTMVWLAFETVLPVGALLPLLFTLYEGFLGPRRLLSSLAAALVLGTMVVMGHLQYVLYVGMLTGFALLFALWRSWRASRSWREGAAIAGCFALTGALGLLIGSVEMVPMREAVELSSRGARTFTFSGLFETLGRVPAQWWATLAFPDYFGNPVLGFGAIPGNGRQEYMNYNELTLYLGVPALFALAAVPFALRRLQARYWALLALLLALMLMGTPAFWPFFAFFPGLSRLNPTRMIFPFVFAASAAAAFGFAAIDGLTRRKRAWLAGAFGAIVVAVAALAAVSARPEVIRAFFGPLPMNAATEAWLLGVLGRQRALASPVVLKPLLLTLAAGALFAVYALVRRRRAVTLAAGAAILALLGYDLISFGWHYNGAFPPSYLYGRTPAIDFVSRQPRPFRVVQDTGHGLYVNTLAPFGIEELGGYTGVYPNRVNKLLSLIEFGPDVLRGAVFDRWVMFRTLSHPLFDLLNVRYVLTRPGVQIAQPGYREVFRGDLSVYENQRALPRAFAVHRATVVAGLTGALERLGSPGFDPRGEVVLEEPPAPGFAPAVPPPPGTSAVTIERYGSDGMEIAASLAANGWVVVSNSNYPGWRATVDGREARLLTADAAVQAVAVPAGNHRIVLSYASGSLRRGAWLSVLGLALALGGAAGLLVAARRRARRTEAG